MAAAIEAAEGPAFDAVAGYTMATPKAAPTDPNIAIAFARLDLKELRRLTLALSARERRHPTEADDAVQDAFLDLLVKQREILLGAPGSWLGHLYERARRRLQEVGCGEGVLSTEALREERDDAFLDGARPCVAESHSADEQSRHASPPGRFWTREQILGALQRFRDHHGRAPRATEFRAINGLPSLTTLYRHFDTLADALLAAGMVPDSSCRNRRIRPPIAVARECRAFRRRHGRWPYSRDVKRHPGELSSTTVMIRCFGSTRAVDIQLGAESILAAVGEPTA